MKECGKCKKKKHIKEFGKYWHKNNKNFLVRSMCRVCFGVYQKEWKVKNRDKQNGYCKKWIIKNRKKFNAHMALNRAVKSGKVKKKFCEKCNKKAQAHHPDYNKPLSVIWLCPFHHKEIHRTGSL